MRGARYRIMSFVTGTTLLLLCCTLILHTVDLKAWQSIHLLVDVVGMVMVIVLYPIYLVMSFQVALKAHFTWATWC